MSRPVKDGLSLLIGAGIGVGLMYLFDPELGSDRRNTIKKGAGSTASDAFGAAKNFGATVADYTPSFPKLKKIGKLGAMVSPTVGVLKEAYDYLGDHLHGLGDHLHGQVDQLHDQALGAASSAKSTAVSAADDAQDKAGSLKAKLLNQLSERVNTLSGPAKEKYAKALHDLSLQLDPDEDHHYVGQTACALGSLALGAGLVYFLDTDKGHERRDNMASAVSSTVGEIGSFFRKVGKRLIHQGQGLADQATEKLGPIVDQVSDLKEQYIGSPAQTPDSSSTTEPQSYTSTQ